MRLRVGVSGHREPPKLSADALAPIRASIEQILGTISAAVRKQTDAMAAQFARDRDQLSADGGIAHAHLTIVSSLAEGADHIVAEAGLAAGFTLESVLPFAKDEYVKHFATEESRAKFDELLGSASSVFILDGSTKDQDRPRAYETAGLIMLHNIDLLIAIWNGEEADGRGGTAEIVGRAITDGMPIIWIDPATPDMPKLSWSPRGQAPPANASARPRETFGPIDDVLITQAVVETLSLPRDAEKSLRQYLGEPRRHWNWCPWFPLLQWVFAGEPIKWSNFYLRPLLSHTREKWDGYFAMLPADKVQRPAIEQVLLPAYSAANHLAVYYSLVYRSTYVFNFLFAFVAVGLALAGIFIHDPVTKSYFVVIELLVILAILLTWHRGHSRQWHRRWLDYRRLAECLRVMRVLALVGSGGPIERSGRSLDGDEQDWVNWYALSVRRVISLPHRTIDPGYMTAVRDATREAEIKEQIGYNADLKERMGKLDRHMHKCAQILLGVTLFLCFAFLSVVAVSVIASVALPNTEFIRTYVLGAFTLATALLPTLGAALGAIRAQGDFKTVAEQAELTAKRLEIIDRILAGEPLNFARLSDRMEKASDVMMADLREWQTLFRARPLSPPV
jgi:hypothetical protein